MQDKTPREQRAPYTGRFADMNSGARKRGIESARLRAASDTQARRPSGFDDTEAVKRRAYVSSKAADEGANKKKSIFLRLLRREKPEESEKIRNKRSQLPRLSWWEKLLIGVIALALIVLILTLIFGGKGKTYHQMPRIERGADYEPAESTLPAGEGSATIDYSQYLTTPTAESDGQQVQSGGGAADGIDYSQYLVTPKPGESIGDAAAAAGANYEATGGRSEGASNEANG